MIINAPPDIKNNYPALNQRALGWLRFLHQKTSTQDDWSEDGEPHPWWDRYSTEPTLNFARFDLSESSYAIAMMADQTPAWREIYSDILKQLARRHLTFWAAYDWLTQFGPDPRRENYPDEWIALFIPDHLVGQYDTPGWVANGVEPWGLQKDPIGADGNLFFKGWLNLIQSLYTYVSGKADWQKPFQVAGVNRSRFEWTQDQLVSHLAAQWTKNPIGPHCENTKIWPYCLSAAGLGFQLYDQLFDKNAHQTYHAWLEHTKNKYYGINKKGELEWTTFYYDPLVNHLQTTGPMMGLPIAFYTMPQEPAFAEFLYRAAIHGMGWDDPSQPVFMPMPDPRMCVLGLAVAKEFGDDITYARLRAYGEQHFEPRFFGQQNEQFGFWFHLNEDWPRGQLSALAMVAEVGQTGSWQKLFRQPNRAKHNEPTLCHVDYPALQVAQAFNDIKGGFLQLTLFAGDPQKKGQPSSFHITQLPDASKVKILHHGEEYGDWKKLGNHHIQINSDINAHQFQIYTGYYGQEQQKQKQQNEQKQQKEKSQQARQQSLENLMAGQMAKLAPALLQPTTSSFSPLGGGACCPVHFSK